MPIHPIQFPQRDMGRGPLQSFFSGLSEGTNLVDSLLKIQREKLQNKYLKPTLEEQLRQLQLNTDILRGSSFMAPSQDEAKLMKFFDLEKLKGSLFSDPILRRMYQLGLARQSGLIPSDIMSAVVPSAGFSQGGVSPSGFSQGIGSAGFPKELGAALGGGESNFLSQINKQGPIRADQARRLMQEKAEKEQMQDLAGEEEVPGDIKTGAAWEAESQADLKALEDYMKNYNPEEEQAPKGYPLAKEQLSKENIPESDSLASFIMSAEKKGKQKSSQGGLSASEEKLWTKMEPIDSEAAINANKMLDTIEQFQKAYKGTSLKGPVKGLVPATGVAGGLATVTLDKENIANAQTADNAAANMIVLMGNMMKGQGPVTAAKYKLFEKTKPHRAMDEKTAQEISNRFKAEAYRVQERQEFLSEAKEMGINRTKADSLWSKYNQEVPIFDTQKGKVIEKNRNKWKDYFGLSGEKGTYKKQPSYSKSEDPLGIGVE